MAAGINMYSGVAYATAKNCTLRLFYSLFTAMLYSLWVLTNICFLKTYIFSSAFKGNLYKPRQILHFPDEQEERRDIAEGAAGAD